MPDLPLICTLKPHDLNARAMQELRVTTELLPCAEHASRSTDTVTRLRGCKMWLTYSKERTARRYGVIGVNLSASRE